MASQTGSIPFSVLDLAPIVEGGDATQALRNTLDLARHAERLGHQRFWLAEHHNMPGVASAATAVVIAHVAAGTSTIRVGAGGVMLPNHAPLVIAEQFGTLAALHPGRIDLGLGRAPGTDQATARALRRTLSGDVDRFPEDVAELQGYFRPARPGSRCARCPAPGSTSPSGSSGRACSARSCREARAAVRVRVALRAWGPHGGVALYRGDSARRSSSAEAARHARGQRVRGGHRRGGPAAWPARSCRPSRTCDAASPRLRRRPTRASSWRLAGWSAAELAQVFSCSVVGSPESVRRGLRALLARTGADELMITSQVFDHAARVRSFELVAEAREALAAEGLRSEPAR